MRFRAGNAAAIAMLAAIAMTGIITVGSDLWEEYGPQSAPENLMTADGKPCVSTNTVFTAKDGSNAFVVTLTNACEIRQRCNVSVYIVNSQGPQQGNATLTLAPLSQGAGAEQTYVMKTGQLGGMANVSRQCRRA
jgi:hypothetical protein